MVLFILSKKLASHSVICGRVWDVVKEMEEGRIWSTICDLTIESESTVLGLQK